MGCSSHGAVMYAVKAFFIHMVDRNMGEIVSNFGGFYRELASDRQLCWFMWKLLVDMDAKQLLFCMDSDILLMKYQNGLLGKKERSELKQISLREGWTMFKVKVAADLQNDICRSIERITKPAEFKPSWIKEPAFPDEDMYVQMRHATISKALALLGICVASREHVMIFKQLLQAKALSYLQIDIQHLIIFDYIPVSESLQSRLVIQITPVAIAYGDSFFFLKMLLHGSHSMHLSCYPISPPICGLHRVVRSVDSTSSR
ncbi:unnamed protein product [Bubo scandiacus]